MDRRSFLTGLLGVGAAGALVSVLPRTAEALVAIPPEDPAALASGLPKLENPGLEWDDDIDLAYHEGYPHRRRRRRRRRRVRRYRRECRRRWINGYWRRSCRRVPFWAWVWFWI
jgi:hypothetical protein